MFARFPYESLLEWHEKHGRHDLPWREGFETLPEKDLGYRVWLSEILLQQTQAPRVAGFFQRILERFPTVESLSQTDFETFFPYYDGLGYYSRARNLLAAAQKVVREFGGVFPRETEALLTLPGVGPYTAEAVRAFAYGIATLPFDTNLEKVFSRYYFGTRFRKLTSEEKSEIAKGFRDSGFPARETSGALMDFANTVSLNAVPKIDWEGYPLEGCRFFETRGSLEIRPKKTADRFPTKDAALVAILFDHSGKMLFSENGGRYEPFVIAPTEGDPRKAIKNAFLAKGFSVSVRPAYSKGFLDGAPLAFFRCRVQTGAESDFSAFAPEEFSAWWKNRSERKETDFSKLPA